MLNLDTGAAVPADVGFHRREAREDVHLGGAEENPVGSHRPEKPALVLQQGRDICGRGRDKLSLRIEQTQPGALRVGGEVFAAQGSTRLVLNSKRSAPPTP